MNIGRIYWYLQRYSAIYFLGFVIYIEYLFLTDSFSFDYLDSNFHFKILLTLFILLANVHGFIGLWTVGTDYLTKRTLGFLSEGLGGVANIIRKFYEILFITIGCFVTVLYFLIIWF
jgi:succinate dehydrogenase / fumarate reductase membrane anchor subunit